MVEQKRSEIKAALCGYDGSNKGRGIESSKVQVIEKIDRSLKYSRGWLIEDVKRQR
jgi:hypothetical protein